MNIGLLNQRITIQASTISSDDIGNRIQTWYDLYTCCATVSKESGQEQFNAGRTTDGVTCTFTVRYSSEVRGITPREHRVKFAGAYYNILSVDHMSYKKPMLKLNCEKVSE